MLLKYEIYKMIKQLRNVEFRNFIKYNFNFEIVLKNFSKKISNLFVLYFEKLSKSRKYLI